MKRLLLLLLIAAAPAEREAAFRTELLAANSATAVLQRHCLVPGARIRAERVAVPAKAAPRTLRKALKLQAGEHLRHRRVRLMCADMLFSDADNWYVPQRLTAEMNQLLETGDTPFGRVVASLNPARETLVARRGGKGAAFLTVKAVLRDAAGLPISAVVERYQRRVMSPPRCPHSPVNIRSTSCFTVGTKPLE